MAGKGYGENAQVTVAPVPVKGDDMAKKEKDFKCDCGEVVVNLIMKTTEEKREMVYKGVGAPEDQSFGFMMSMGGSIELVGKRYYCVHCERLLTNSTEEALKMLKQR